ncbi:hypothetical protein Rcae01_00956 [Novipirellula caenicola]|uniref:Uncharacterized protein n=1 Tax=Novipirellula caenicola TaxID=1536901 RepID=A0ABP9VL35_9BACT
MNPFPLHTQRLELVLPSVEEMLTKCGFPHIGEVMDPDNGLVWRWEKHPIAV